MSNNLFEPFRNCLSQINFWPYIHVHMFNIKLVDFVSDAFICLQLKHICLINNSPHKSCCNQTAGGQDDTSTIYLMYSKCWDRISFKILQMLYSNVHIPGMYSKFYIPIVLFQLLYSNCYIPGFVFQGLYPSLYSKSDIPKFFSSGAVA